MPTWLLLVVMGVVVSSFIGVMIARAVKALNRNPQVDANSIRRDAEDALLAKFRYWDRHDTSIERRIAELQEMVFRGELPDYVKEADFSDPDAIRQLVARHVEARDTTE